MYNGRGQADKARALRLPRKSASTRTLEKIWREEVKATLAESFMLAEAIASRNADLNVIGDECSSAPSGWTIRPRSISRVAAKLAC